MHLKWIYQLNKEYYLQEDQAGEKDDYFYLHLDRQLLIPTSVENYWLILKKNIWYKDMIYNRL